MRREDLRILKTRQAIRTAMLSLLREKDFESVTVKDIISRAVIGKGTFYYHYKDKYDLVEQLVKEDISEWGDNLMEYLRDRDDPDRRKKMETVYENLLLYRNIRTREISMDSLLKKNLREVYSKQMTRWPDLNNSQLTARLIAALIYELLFAQVESHTASSPSEFENAMADIHTITGIFK